MLPGRVSFLLLLQLSLLLASSTTWRVRAIAEEVWSLDEHHDEESDEPSKITSFSGSPLKQPHHVRRRHLGDTVAASDISNWTTTMTDTADSFFSSFWNKNRTSANCPRGFSVIYRPTHWCSKNFTCGRGRSAFHVTDCGCGCQPSTCTAISYKNTTCPKGFKCETKGCLKNVTSYNLSGVVCAGTCRPRFHF